MPGVRLRLRRERRAEPCEVPVDDLVRARLEDHVAVGVEDDLACVQENDAQTRERDAEAQPQPGDSALLEVVRLLEYLVGGDGLARRPRS